MRSLKPFFICVPLTLAVLFTGYTGSKNEIMNSYLYETQQTETKTTQQTCCTEAIDRFIEQGDHSAITREAIDLFLIDSQFVVTVAVQGLDGEIDYLEIPVHYAGYYNEVHNFYTDDHVILK
jgi:hypothetical protein